MSNSARTIILKIGSSTLTSPEGKLDSANLHRIVSEVAALVKTGQRFLIVTSGAIVTGSERRS